MVTRPTDQEICGAIRKMGGRAITAVIAGILRQTHGADLKTDWVRARLFYLQKHGNVRQIDSNYVTQHCWANTDLMP